MESLYRDRLEDIYSTLFRAPGPYDLPEKTSKIIRTSDFPPVTIFWGPGTGNFSSLPA